MAPSYCSLTCRPPPFRFSPLESGSSCPPFFQLRPQWISLTPSRSAGKHDQPLSGPRYPFLPQLHFRLEFSLESTCRINLTSALHTCPADGVCLLSLGSGTWPLAKFFTRRGFGSYGLFFRLPLLLSRLLRLLLGFPTLSNQHTLILPVSLPHTFPNRLYFTVTFFPVVP